ncbi:MAG: hypothetical protein ACRC01_03275, partial [Deefgea sp.]
MTSALMEWETIDREQVLDIMAGREPRPPKGTPATVSIPTLDAGNLPTGGAEASTTPATEV